MRRAFAAMGTALLVVAIGLVIYAGQADRQQQTDELTDAMLRDRGQEGLDVGAGGRPWRIAAAGAGGVGLVLLVGAAAAKD